MGDIRRWIQLSLNEKECKGMYVQKGMNTGNAYVRSGKDCDLKTCVRRIGSRALMGCNPKLTILNDENAKKIWKQVAWKIGDEVQDRGKEAAADTNIKQEDEDVDLAK